VLACGGSETDTAETDTNTAETDTVATSFACTVPGTTAECHTSTEWCRLGRNPDAMSIAASVASCVALTNTCQADRSCACLDDLARSHPGLGCPASACTQSEEDGALTCDRR
jgi:hypothetical protein